MANIGTMVVGLIANTTNFEKGMTRSRQQLTVFQGAVAKVNASLSGMLAGGAAVYGLYRGLKYATQQAIEAEKSEIMLAAAISGTVKNVSAAVSEFKRFASEIQSQTIYGDEAILQQMAYGRNLGVTTDRLKESTVAAAGLAAKYKLDLATAMMLVGRASQGQTQMLTRYGIVLDNSLTTQEKFNELLRIGSENFYLARSEAASTEGKIISLKNALGDMAEVVGGSIIPLIDVLVGKFKETQATSQAVAANIASITKVVAYAVAGVMDFVGAIYNLLKLAISGIMQITGTALHTISMLASFLGIELETLTAIGDGLYDVGVEMQEAFQQFMKAPSMIRLVSDAFDNVTDSATKAASAIGRAAESTKKFLTQEEDDALYAKLMEGVADKSEKMKSLSPLQLGEEVGRFIDVAGLSGSPTTDKQNETNKLLIEQNGILKNMASLLVMN